MRTLHDATCTRVRQPEPTVAAPSSYLPSDGVPTVEWNAVSTPTKIARWFIKNAAITETPNVLQASLSSRLCFKIHWKAGKAKGGYLTKEILGLD